MYIVPSSLDMALEDNGLAEWPSIQHQEAAEIVLLGNPCITNRDVLAEQAKIILDIPADQILKMSLRKLRQKGILI